MSSKLSRVLDRQALREMAGERYFERGEEYSSDGSVRGLAEHEEVITAKVLGTRSYRVKLWAEDGGLDYSCTCPLGADGEFCKHCVAVGLTWLSPSKDDGRAAGKPASAMKDVGAFLAAQSNAVLVKMLTDQAMDDERLRRRLLLKAAAWGRGKVDLAAYKNVIDAAVDADGFVDYHEAGDYAEGIEEAVDSVEELLKEGHAAQTVELVEHALRSVERAIGSVDDSGGRMGGIMERLQEMHLAACRKAEVDPVSLARRLFQWESGTQWDTFYDASRTYARILGKEGLAAYKKLAEAEWACVPPRTAREQDDGASRSRITRIMETLAEQAGDVEAIVAIKRRDLSSAYAYLMIAEAYKRARKLDLALEWAEKGAKAFPEKTDSRLRSFLAEEYHRRGRHDEAMALVWSEFAENAELSEYRGLKSHADRAGQWLVWREKALAFLKENLAREKSAAEKRRWGGYPEDVSSELVQIHLWEKDAEAAWRQAKDDGCSEELWLKLASSREARHPDDALSVYRARVSPALDQTNDAAYRQAVELLRKIRGLMGKVGRQAEFARYLGSIRSEYKRKRNFIRLLDRERWRP